MTKPFASHGDMEEKQITFRQLSEHGFAYEAESDPTSGVIIGDDAVMVIDTRATPDLAQDLIARVRERTDKPIRYVVLTHYHAVRVLGASAYGADHIICSDMTLDMIRERGEADFRSEVERFPRLFRNVEGVPGLTYPTMTFSAGMTLWLGGTEVRLSHLGRGHTRGDIVVQLPQEKVLFSGDLVENGAAVYTGDAHIGDWIGTLDRVRALEPDILVPGRGPALTTAQEARAAIDSTQDFLKTLYGAVKAGVADGGSLRDVYDLARREMDPKYGDWPIYEHCIPFDVSRCYDEVQGIDNPRIWTAERDREMWATLQG